MKALQSLPFHQFLKFVWTHCCVFVDFFTGSDSIQGTWCKDILKTIMDFTPHNWASHTLSCFPAPLQVGRPLWAK